MLEAKYIRTSNDEIIIFPAHMAHSQFRGFDPKSAGFVWFDVKPIPGDPLSPGRVVPKCYGKSESLGVTSMEEDSELVHRQITRSAMY